MGTVAYGSFGVRHKACSDEHKSAAAEAYDMVIDCVGDARGRTVTAQLRDAADVLTEYGLEQADGRVWRAFRLRAGAKARDYIKAAWLRWKADQDRALSDVASDLAQRVAALREAINESGDSEFYQPYLEAHLDALERVLNQRGNLGAQEDAGGSRR